MNNLVSLSDFDPPSLSYDSEIPSHCISFLLAQHLTGAKKTLRLTKTTFLPHPLGNIGGVRLPRQIIEEVICCFVR
jgi:hypothetical protein